jgi:1-acyl-sn-glycerol-3-phosphate acyltransferase
LRWPRVAVWGILTGELLRCFSMMNKREINGDYHSPDRKIGWIARRAPGPVFYSRMILTVISGALAARRHRYNGERWIQDSRRILGDLESVGVKVSIENTGSFANLSSPCVFAGNHMSMLETCILPGIIRSHRKVTFVIKESLLDYPVFKNIMAAVDPIAVSRTNPRLDLQIVLREGTRRLKNSTSVVLFPQPSRSNEFIPSHFNSLGVKLARRAGVPLIPVAIKSDAWGNGRRMKDFGPIYPRIPVHVAFGDPITVTGKGRAAQEQTIQFISEKLRNWGMGNRE